MGKTHNKDSYHKKCTLVILAILLIVVLTATILLEDQYQNTIPVVSTTKEEEKEVDQAKQTTVSFASKEISIHYSLSDFFYQETKMLELSPKSADIKSIYYTLDGSLPDSKSGILYEKPIELVAQTKDKLVNSYTIRACGRREDGSFSEISTHSYFIGEGVKERFDCLVVSLTTDPNNLYNYEDGIFVSGKIRDEYIEENPYVTIQPDSPANFNLRGMESERPVNVEMFTEDGTCIISQKAGMRVHGGWSRANDQKSIKLIARSSYEEGMGSFDYEFFEDASSLDHKKITSYKRLVLRNNANDNCFAFLRDETISECAKDTPLLDTIYARPVAVYLNGEYYGFSWLHSVYDNDYFHAKNGNDEEVGTWKVMDAKERANLLVVEDDKDLLDSDIMERYKKVLSYGSVDLTQEAKFEELSQLIDLDSFLWYYAIQAYIGNTDWPNNNDKVYRYYTPEEIATIESVGNKELSADSNGEDVTSKEAKAIVQQGIQSSDSDELYDNAMDGRFRWLLFDTDFSLGLYDAQPNQETIISLFQPDEKTGSPLLIALLKREDMKERFITILCDLMNDYYSPKKVESVITEKEAIRLHELSYDFKYGSMLPSLWSSLGYVKSEVMKATRYAQQRPEDVREQIKQLFGEHLTEYSVIAPSNEHAVINVNYSKIMPKEDEFHGIYYEGYCLQLSTKIEEGYQFVSWKINGQKYEVESLNLIPDDFVGGDIRIELLVEPKEDATIPIITEVDFKGKNDSFVLYNPYTCKVTTKFMFLSDDEKDLRKNQLPNITLTPGESVRIYCSNYQGIESLGGYSVNFSLKDGETLFLSDRYGNVMEKILLQKLGEGNYIEKDMFTKGFVEKTP